MAGPLDGGLAGVYDTLVDNNANLVRGNAMEPVSREFHYDRDEMRRTRPWNKPGHFTEGEWMVALDYATERCGTDRLDGPSADRVCGYTRFMLGADDILRRLVTHRSQIWSSGPAKSRVVPIYDYDLIFHATVFLGINPAKYLRRLRASWVATELSRSQHHPAVV